MVQLNFDWISSNTNPRIATTARSFFPSTFDSPCTYPLIAGAPPTLIVFRQFAKAGQRLPRILKGGKKKKIRNERTSGYIHSLSTIQLSIGGISQKCLNLDAFFVASPSLDTRAANRFPFAWNHFGFSSSSKLWTIIFRYFSFETRKESRGLKFGVYGGWIERANERKLRSVPASARYHDEEPDLGVRWHHHWLANRRLPSQGIMGYARRGVHHVMRDLTIVLGVDTTQFIDARYSAFHAISSRSRNVFFVVDGTITDYSTRPFAI